MALMDALEQIERSPAGPWSLLVKETFSERESICRRFCQAEPNTSVSSCRK